MSEQISEESRHALFEFDWLDAFQPHPLWRGGWLQTVSIKALRPQLDTDQWPGCVAFDVPGDETPPDQLTGFFLPPETDSSKPTVIVFHGMGGNARSGYMRSMAKTLLRGGFPVILWNNRGAGGSGRSCAKLHHPGYTEDVRRLIRYLQQERPELIANGMAAVAFSLGANLLLRYLGEIGEESAFDAAVSISAPIDMEITSRRLQQGWNRVFDRYLLKQQQAELLRDKADLDSEERDRIRNASSVWELDDTFTAPRFGFEGAQAYYKANSAIHVLDDIHTPTLLFHASDDPVVDDDVFDSRDWTMEGPLYSALAASGGHTGFLDRNGERWHERYALRFLQEMT